MFGVVLTLSVGCGGGGGSSSSRTWKGFDAPIAYTTPGGGSSITAADLTGDGAADVITLRGADRADIFTNRGDGTLEALRDHAVGADPARSVVADLNKDNRPDLLVIGHFDNGFRVWLGQEGGTIGGSEFYALANHGRHIVTGDWNQDGNLDVLAIHDGSGNPAVLQVFLGDGTGKLTPGWSYRTEITTSRDVIAADITGDGKGDLLVSFADTQISLLIFPGNGDGTFRQPQPSFVAGTLEGSALIAIGDVTGDALPDMVMTTAGNALSLRRGQAGGFGDPELLPLPSIPADVAIVDVDGDGRNDIVATLSEAGEIVCLPSLGSGAFGTAIRFPVGGNPFWLAVADLDRDARPDIAVRDVAGARLLTLKNKGR
jgi:hypothetical protein